MGRKAHERLFEGLQTDGTPAELIEARAKLTNDRARLLGLNSRGLTALLAVDTAESR